ncbi:hypothetical protein QLX08_004912 [Tetragonisca angustula]|uniref:CIDE-N domain-containing protein n=1 Tax=Tetragonisca angustula TaxID=166442 RepID=A0AAW1A387_9HYME
MSLIANCFRRLAEAPAKNELKGYKVTDVNRMRKIGVACRSLHELKQKACAKLNITNDPGEVNIYLLDGSLIDEEEYFSTLKPQTTLILQKPGEKVLTDADLLYDTLRRVNIDFLIAGEKASEFLTENLKAKVAVLNNALNKDDSKTAFSGRDEHPEWFYGLETNCATKEAYLHRRCQDRIRGYLYKTIEQIRSSDVFAKDPRARKQLLYAIAFFKMQLKEDHYFGYYFDRSRARIEASEGADQLDSSACYDHCPCRLKWLDDGTYFRLFGTAEQSDDVDGVKKRNERNSAAVVKTEEEADAEENCPYKIRRIEEKMCIALCDQTGEFRCHGVWNEEKCPYGTHKINPYRSKEELVLFSTWNFDHKIERSRALIPLLLKLASKGAANEADLIEIYDNLFTIKNLRLVHIVCHDKSSHK